MTPLAQPASPQDRPLLDYERYAITIFEWCKGHPDSTRDEFLAMLARADAKSAAIRACRH